MEVEEHGKPRQQTNRRIGAARVLCGELLDSTNEWLETPIMVYYICWFARNDAVCV